MTEICTNKFLVETYLNLESKTYQLTNPRSAFAYYKDKSINLLNGDKKIIVNGIDTVLDKIKLNSKKNDHRIFHLCYELGLYYHDLNELLDDNDLLAIDIIYENKDEVSFNNRSEITLSIKEELDFEEYQGKFEKIYSNLVAGNTYQVNLTCKSVYHIENTYNEFLKTFWTNKNRSRYAHSTYIEYFDKSIISNSPECLYEVKYENSKYFLRSYPIKGTIPRTDSDDIELLWEKLESDKKNRCELNIITDLIRNDLSKIELPRARVIKNIGPLLVPGILHQFSEIEVELSESITLQQILKSIFPGGSITGAPKRNVLKIINEIEKNKRSFYCGSTIYLNDNYHFASINIRTSEIDFKNKLLSYCSGGGITLLSNARDEYEEMLLKRSSFLNLFNC